MPKLIVLSEQYRGQIFELDKEIHTCGRVPERDICIKDATISSHHCDFIQSGNTYIVQDKNSTNGTRVNNVPITEQELQNSDIIQVGGIEVLYDCDDKSVTTVMKTQTGINLDGSDLEFSTVKKMDNFDPFAKKKGGSSNTSKLIMLVIAILIIVILGLLVYVLFLSPGQ